MFLLHGCLTFIPKVTDLGQAILKHLQANTMALLTLITPVLALFLGKVLNNEVIGLMTYMGSGMILLGLVLYQVELMRIPCRD